MCSQECYSVRSVTVLQGLFIKIYENHIISTIRKELKKLTNRLSIFRAFYDESRIQDLHQCRTD